MVGQNKGDQPKPGVKSVVIHLNFGQQAFDWVDLGVGPREVFFFFFVKKTKKGSQTQPQRYQPFATS